MLIGERCPRKKCSGGTRLCQWVRSVHGPHDQNAICNMELGSVTQIHLQRMCSEDCAVSTIQDLQVDMLVILAMQDNYGFICASQCAYQPPALENMVSV